MEIKKWIKEYQCPGCVGGPATECYIKGNSHACSKHVYGTTVSNIGRIALGLPIGFNRVGPIPPEYYPIMIFSTFEELHRDWAGYSKFNSPVWKYLNKEGHTLIRGLSPRTNLPFIHIILEDCISKIDCLEITEKDIKSMD